MAYGDHPRLFLPSFLSSDLCQELEFIHKSCSTVGYRPNVFSTTLSHLIATNFAHLILPFIPIRENLKEKVEEFFGCEYELFVEFTGLISWCRGANIGWHSDDNRPYLKQRHFAAVCYLNSHGKDFKGGVFHFKDAEPANIVPIAGDAVIYTADSRNMHSVDEITEGERLTLTMWFTRDQSYDEDAKLLNLLSRRRLSHQDIESITDLPCPAPSNMYWFSPESSSESGCDIRWARLHVLGYDIYSSDNWSLCSTTCTSSDASELLNSSLRLARGDGTFEGEFINCLHALQVVQFYHWKASLLLESICTKSSNSVGPMKPPSENVKYPGILIPGDCELAERTFGFIDSNARRAEGGDWLKYSASVSLWDDYVQRLQRELRISIHQWTTHQAIFSLDLSELC